MIDTPFESNVNTAGEKHFSAGNKHSGIVVDDEVLKYH